MKLFLTILALFAVSSAGSLPLSSEQDLQGIADFWKKVKEIYKSLVELGSDFVCSAKLQQLLDILGLPDQLDGAVDLAQQWLCGSDEVQGAVVGESFVEAFWRIVGLLKEKGSEFVCSAKLQELLDILGLPDQLDGTVELAQKWICGDSAALVKRSSDVQALEGFSEWFKELLAKLKAYGKDLVCTAKLQELLEILGLPDALQGAVKMAQDLICGSSARVKREITMTPEMHVQLVGGFRDTVKEIIAKLKSYAKALVCSSRLQQLLDLLGLPDQLDGAVKLAQKWICGGEVGSTALMVTNPSALEGFYETIMEIFDQLVVLGQSFVCNSGITEIIASLGLPDTLVWAVKVAVDWFCN